MAKRKCPRDSQQDGICGCPLFWKRSIAKSISKFNINGMSTPSTGSSSSAIVIDGQLEDDSDLHRRKRKKGEDSAVPRAGGMGLSRSKSLTYTDSKVMVGEHAEQKQNTAQANTRAHESGLVKRKKAKMSTPVRVLVDYELPTGVKRLDWDTDEVRRMVGEIKGGGYRV